MSVKQSSILDQRKLNISEAAAALNMSRTTFNRHRAAGDLPNSISIAGREFWLAADLEQWIFDQNPHLAQRQILRHQAMAVAKKAAALRAVQ